MAAFTSVGVCVCDGQPGAGRHEHRQTGGLGGADHREHVLVGEHPLDRDRVGAVLGDPFGEAGFDQQQPLRQLQCARRW